MTSSARMPRMGRGRIGRWATLVAVAMLLVVAAPFACTHRKEPAEPPPNTPVVRVRLQAQQERATLRVTAMPTVKAESEMTALRLNMPFDSDASVVLTADGWQISGVAVPGK